MANAMPLKDLPRSQRTVAPFCRPSLVLRQLYKSTACEHTFPGFEMAILRFPFFLKDLMQVKIDHTALQL
jgi:hypothetical protein